MWSDLQKLKEAPNTTNNRIIPAYFIASNKYINIPFPVWKGKVLPTIGYVIITVVFQKIKEQSLFALWIFTYKFTMQNHENMMNT